MTKKFIGSLLISLFCFSQITFAFSDVDSNEEYSKDIEALLKSQAVSGYADNTFRPKENVNKAEFLKMVFILAKITDLDAFKNDNSLKNCFPDVRDEWFSQYVCYAKKMGWVKGHADGLFHPEKTVNFAEAAKIINIFLGYVGQKDTIWYRPYVKYMSKNNDIPPSIKTIDQNLSRAEVAQILSRSYDLKSEIPCGSVTFEWKGDNPVRKLDFGGYRLYDGKVFYRYYLESNDYKEFRGVDYNTFENIGGNCTFFKDRNHIFFDGKILDQADVKSFKMYQKPYENYFLGKDGKIYYINGYSNEVILVESADVQTFHPHTYEYLPFFVDKNHVFNQGKKVEGSDALTFQVLDENVLTNALVFHYGKDKNNVYLITSYEGTFIDSIPQADVNSFEIVADKVWKDKNNVYFWDRKIDNVQPDQIAFLGRIQEREFFLDFFRNGQQVYYYGITSNAMHEFTALADVDPDTFKIVNSTLAQDKTHQYSFENGSFVVKSL